MHHGSDTLIGKDLQNDGMRDGSIEDVDAVDALLHGIGAALHLGDHAAGDDAGGNEVIDLIHSAGGLAVLAHPAVYDSDDLMQELTADTSLDGVEVWHPKHSEEQSEKYQAYAIRHGLLTTGGSDFHGMYSSSLRSLGSFGAPNGIVQLMQTYKNKRHK